MMIWRMSCSALVVAALAACAPSGKDEHNEGPPIGYELAMVDAGESGLNAIEEPAIKYLSVDQLRAKLEAGNVRLIDVRTAEEVAEGFIPGAEHIALVTFDPEALDLSDGREVVLYCRSGRRSGIAAERLSNHTGEPAQHLAGGILAWREAGQPVSSD